MGRHERNVHGTADASNSLHDIATDGKHRGHRNRVGLRSSRSWEAAKEKPITASLFRGRSDPNTVFR